MSAVLNFALPISAVPISITPLLLLSAIFAASLSVFLVLTHRWTSHRLSIELADWAKEHSFSMRSAGKAVLPEPLASQKFSDAQVCWLIGNETTSLVRWTTTNAGWNVLVRRTISDWPATALRPRHAGESSIDLFKLDAFPHLMASDRFTVVGSDRVAARRMARSQARALLPADIGMMRLGEYLILDFSSRPFDPIEFGRMIAVADQLERVA